VFFVGDNRPEGAGDRWEWAPALRRVLEALDIRLLGCLGLSPDFYREGRDRRKHWRTELAATLEAALTGPFAEAALLTHNPVGEYGHPDHVAVLQTVLDIAPEQRTFITDLCYEEKCSPLLERLFYQGAAFGPFPFEPDSWDKAREAYESSYRWTARDSPGALQANLYEL
jgi:LmbE family N-acetylglucosaminyl deacetylase